MKLIRKKPNVIALIGLLALSMIGSSFAYWNYTSSIGNEFDTGSYGSTIREDFKPADGVDWQPGVEINKDVFAVNTGDTDLIVRARLDETWVRKSTASADPGVTYKDSKNDPYDVYTTSQADPVDGLTAADGSVVTKTFSGSTNWVYNSSDGWYYYVPNLAAGATSDPWLDSVTLLDNTDMGKFETTYYVTTSNDANEALWVWHTYTGSMPKYLNAAGVPCNAGDAGAQEVLHNKAETTYVKDGSGKDLIGYSQSDYTLTVTVQTVQPTQEALNAVFGSGSPFTHPSGTTWVLKDD